MLTSSLNLQNDIYMMTIGVLQLLGGLLQSNL